MYSRLKIIFAVIFLAVSLVSPAANAAEGQLEGFGKIKFGMTRTTVKELLGDQITQYEDLYVGYRTSIEGHPVYVFQYFDAPRSLERSAATKATINFGSAKTSRGAVALFGRALKMLVSSYGTPSEGVFESLAGPKEAFWYFDSGGAITLSLWGFRVTVTFEPASKNGLSRF